MKLLGSEGTITRAILLELALKRNRIQRKLEGWFIQERKADGQNTHILM